MDEHRRYGLECVILDLVKKGHMKYVSIQIIKIYGR